MIAQGFCAKRKKLILTVVQVVNENFAEVQRWSHLDVKGTFGNGVAAVEDGDGQTSLKNDKTTGR